MTETAPEKRPAAVAAEATRSTAEATRSTAKATRSAAEATRSTPEAARSAAEATRSAPEATRSAGLTESAARLRLAIVRAARRLRQEAAGAGGAELSPTAASALATVERHGPLTPSDLAEIERVKRPTATRTLRLLTDAGLVDRAPDPDDGRSALVSASAAGRERLRRLRGRKNAYLARRMRDLPAEDVETLERAATILERILEAPEGARR